MEEHAAVADSQTVGRLHHILAQAQRNLQVVICAHCCSYREPAAHMMFCTVLYCSAGYTLTPVYLPGDSQSRVCNHQSQRARIREVCSAQERYYKRARPQSAIPIRAPRVRCRPLTTCPTSRQSCRCSESAAGFCCVLYATCWLPPQCLHRSELSLHCLENAEHVAQDAARHSPTLETRR